MNFIFCHRLTFLIFTLTVAGLFFTTAGNGQTKFGFHPSVEAEFLAAITAFRAGELNAAANVFDSLASDQEIHQRSTASYIMAAKSYVLLTQYERSIELLNEFLQRFPSSSYRPDAYYALGISLLGRESILESIHALNQSMELSQDTALDRNCFRALHHVAVSRLTTEEVGRLCLQYERSPARFPLTLVLAERKSLSGQVKEADSLLQTLMSDPGVRVYQSEIASLRNGSQGEERVSRIAVLLPLLRQGPASHPIKQLAEEVLSGCNYALEEYLRTKPTQRVELDIQDSGRDTTSAMQVMRAMANSSEVVAAIGPLFSNVAFVCARIANASHLPMISPTATSNGIAATGEYVFQSNPDFSFRGKAIARFAIEGRGYSRFAILAPDDSIGRALAEGFMRELQHQGSIIVAHEYYVPGAGDLREQFMNIRRAASNGEAQYSFAGKIDKSVLQSIAQAGAPQEMVDSLRKTGGVATVTELFGPNGRRIADSLQLKLILPPVDSEDLKVAVSSIDGIFIPVNNAEEIGVISAQLRYFNIDAQILGSNEWYEPTQLNAHRQYTDSVIFVSDFFLDQSYGPYQKFEAGYMQANRQRPTKYTVYGYDVTKLILEQIAVVGNNREALAQRLAAVERFSGAHAPITLTEGRVNSELHVLQYSGGIIMRIGSISLH